MYYYKETGNRIKRDKFGESVIVLFNLYFDVLSVSYLNLLPLNFYHFLNDTSLRRTASRLHHFHYSIFEIQKKFPVVNVL